LARDLGSAPSRPPQLNGIESINNRRDRDSRRENQSDTGIHVPPFERIPNFVKQLNYIITVFLILKAFFLTT